MTTKDERIGLIEDKLVEVEALLSGLLKQEAWNDPSAANDVTHRLRLLQNSLTQQREVEELYAVPGDYDFYAVPADIMQDKIYYNTVLAAPQGVEYVAPKIAHKDGSSDYSQGATLTKLSQMPAPPPPASLPPGAAKSDPVPPPAPVTRPPPPSNAPPAAPSASSSAATKPATEDDKPQHWSRAKEDILLTNLNDIHGKIGIMKARGDYKGPSFVVDGDTGNEKVNTRLKQLCESAKGSTSDLAVSVEQGIADRLAAISVNSAYKGPGTKEVVTGRSPAEALSEIQDAFKWKSRDTSVQVEGGRLKDRLSNLQQSQENWKSKKT